MIIIKNCMKWSRKWWKFFATNVQEEITKDSPTMNNLFALKYEQFAVVNATLWKMRGALCIVPDFVFFFIFFATIARRLLSHRRVFHTSTDSALINSFRVDNFIMLQPTSASDDRNDRFNNSFHRFSSPTPTNLRKRTSQCLFSEKREKNLHLKNLTQ